MVDMKKIEACVVIIEGPMRQMDAKLPDGTQVQVDMTPEIEMNQAGLNATEKKIVSQALKMRRIKAQLKSSKKKMRQVKLKSHLEIRRGYLATLVGLEGLDRLDNIPAQ